MKYQLFIFVAFLSFSVLRAGAEDDAISPETKAIIKTAIGYLKDKKADDRIKGADMLGELGVKAKTARRDLCAALMDKNAKVQTAAADALKRVDSTMAEAALKIYINGDAEAITKLESLGTKAEPLTPLVLEYSKQVAAKSKAKKNEYDDLYRCIKVLAAIAPDDEGANKFVISGLASTYPKIRQAAVVACRTMTYGKTAILQIADIAKRATIDERMAAIETLVTISDATTKKGIEKVLNAMRFDPDTNIRKAVQDGLDKINSNEKKN
jgi:hypothetical protein